jgi:hypothetical protein
VSAPLSEVLVKELAVYLGPHTARTAVKTFSERALGKGPESVEREEMGELLEALRPMLRTLLGSDQSDAVLARIEDELGL